ncbi:hypothetical protein DXG01_002944 [Tephrocybe rancida]|nr:hypothetical protein DXG01_002944 [Tephrocybe rancida]
MERPGHNKTHLKPPSSKPPFMSYNIYPTYANMYSTQDIYPPNIKYEPIFQLEKEHQKAGANLEDKVVLAVQAELESQEAKFTLTDDVAARTSASTDVGLLLRRSNHQPTSTQVSLIKSALVEKNTALAQIDSDMMRLQLKINESIAAMKALEKSRLEKQAEANYCESWLSSVRLLPVEVLTRIFKFSITYHGTYPWVARGGSPFPLSHVCTTWRSAALSCSSFWNKLEVDISGFERKAVEGQSIAIESLLNMWYGRAHRSRLLKFVIVVGGSVADAIDRDLARSITIFSPRMKSVRIIFESSLNGLTASLSIPGGSFSSLESLSLLDVNHKIYPSESDSPVISAITAFDHSPCLREVTLRISPQLLQADTRLLLPWKQLTHLYMGGPVSGYSFATVFLQCTQLIVVTFPNIGIRDHTDIESAIPPSPVIFPHLTDFIVSLGGSLAGLLGPNSNISEVLDMVKLPKLERFEVAGAIYAFNGRYLELFPAEPIIPNIPSICFPPLRYLSLLFSNIHLDDLLDILRACPALEQLALCPAVIPPFALLKSLTRRNAHREENLEPAPHLSSLTYFQFAYVITGEDDQNEPDALAFSEAFLALITSWARDPLRRCPLEEISLFVCDDRFAHPSHEDSDEFAPFEQIADLVEKGIADLKDDVTSSDILFDTCSIGSYKYLLSAFGFTDKTESECRFDLY